MTTLEFAKKELAKTKLHLVHAKSRNDNDVIEDLEAKERHWQNIVNSLNEEEKQYETCVKMVAYCLNEIAEMKERLQECKLF